MSLGAIDPGRSDWMRQQAPRAGRAAVAIPVYLHGDDGPTSGVTHNISPDGLFVATGRVLPIGERVMLMLAFPGQRRPLAARAEVRWSRATPAPADERR